MKLYLISQNKNNDYDTYDSAVVAALSSSKAKMVHPRNGEEIGKEGHTTWVSSPDDVQVVCLGTAKPGTKAGVILASFNAG